MTDFDQRAKDWDSDPQRVERAQVVAQAIRAALPARPGQTALEIGCGTGLLSFALQDVFAHITLADTSQGMLDVLTAKIAAARLKHFSPIRLDIASAPPPLSRFDAVYSLLALHHIADTAAFLRHSCAALHPGGWLFLADLDAEDGTFHNSGASGAHPGFERPALQRQVEAAGFYGVNFLTVFIIQKNDRQYPMFLLSARKHTSPG